MADLRHGVYRVRADIVASVEVGVAPIALEVVVVGRGGIARRRLVVHGVAEGVSNLARKPSPGGVAQRNLERVVVGSGGAHELRDVAVISRIHPIGFVQRDMALLLY